MEAAASSMATWAQARQTHRYVLRHTLHLYAECSKFAVRMGARASHKRRCEQVCGAVKQQSSLMLQLQAFMQGGGQDHFDEEVGQLSQAVGRLKGMVTAIGEEARETGKIQDIVAKQLEAGQVRCSVYAAMLTCTCCLKQRALCVQACRATLCCWVAQRIQVPGAAFVCDHVALGHAGDADSRHAQDEAHAQGDDRLLRQHACAVSVCSGARADGGLPDTPTQNLCMDLLSRCEPL